MADNMDRTTFVKKVIGLFIKTNRMHREAFAYNAASFGLHRSQHKMIMHLHGKEGGLSQKELAKHMDVSPAAITVMINKLVASGFVKRSPYADDSRVNLILLTEKGEDVAVKSRVFFDGVDSTMLEGFSNEEIATLHSFFERMQKNMAEAVEKR